MADDFTNPTQKHKKKWSFTLRSKMIAVLLLALISSLFATIFLGTSLIVRDKTSYIYDHQLAQLKSHTLIVENQIKNILAFSNLIGSLLLSDPQVDQAVLPNKTETLVSEIYRTHSERLGLKALKFIHPNGEAHSQLRKTEFGSHDNLSKALEAQGWNNQKISQMGLFVNRSLFYLDPPAPDDKKEAVLLLGASLNTSGTFEKLSFVALIGIPHGIFREIPPHHEIALVDRSGDFIYSSFNINDSEISQPTQQLGLELLTSLRDSKHSLLPEAAQELRSGVRLWNFPREDWIVSYHSILENNSLIVAYVPKRIVFDAAKTLKWNIILVGTGILFMSLGLVLLLIRNMLFRIKQLKSATLKATEGDFSVRVQTDERFEDELSSLAVSYNRMATRIDELLVEAAEKIRLKHEFEMAQAVQKKFFPKENLSLPNVQLAGAVLPATECAGDWWHYSLNNNHLIILLADVVGHGLSAALVSAMVRGVFLHLTQSDPWSTPGGGEMPSTNIDMDFPRKLIHHLLQTAQETQEDPGNISLLVIDIDCVTGKSLMLNHGHPFPVLFRASKNHPQGFHIRDTGIFSKSKYDKFKAPVLESTLQLEPGDLIFAFTDGTFENRGKDKKRIPKMDFFRKIAESIAQSEATAESTCNNSMAVVSRFFKADGDSPPDDITLVFAKFLNTLPYDSRLIQMLVAS